MPLGNACVAEFLIRFRKESAVMGCVLTKPVEIPPGYEDPIALASQTHFTISEIEALYELFRKLSSSIVDNGCISKEEFQLALFSNSEKQSLFSDRIFELFDSKHKGAIEFGEFVRSLSIFHPNTPEADKISFAFQLYDIWHTGYIERGEVKEMVSALLSESEMNLSDDVIESIVDQTFTAVDSKGDGKIDQDEWREFVARNPSSIQNMTIPYLKRAELIETVVTYETTIEGRNAGSPNFHVVW